MNHAYDTSDLKKSKGCIRSLDWNGLDWTTGLLTKLEVLTVFWYLFVYLWKYAKCYNVGDLIYNNPMAYPLYMYATQCTF